MELRELVSFYHVARLRSVSKAARTLELGQPTVTTHLAKAGGRIRSHPVRQDQASHSAYFRRLDVVGVGHTSGDLYRDPEDRDGLRRKKRLVPGRLPIPDLIKSHMPMGVKGVQREIPRYSHPNAGPGLQSPDAAGELRRSGPGLLLSSSSGQTVHPSNSIGCFDYEPVLLMPKGHPVDRPSRRLTSKTSFNGH